MDKVIEHDITEKLQKKGIDQYMGDRRYKRQSKNVQKWEFKNVQFYSLNISFKR